MIGANIMDFFKKQKKERSVEIAIAKEELRLYLIVFPKISFDVVNIKTEEGEKTPVLALGFDERGVPVVDSEDSHKIKYHVLGSSPMLIMLNRSFRAGRHFYERGEDKQLKKTSVYGFEAVSTLLNGLPPKTIKQEVTKLFNQGSNRIYISRICNWFGMEKPFFKLTDAGYNFSASPFDSKKVSIDYDEYYNSSLLNKKLKSPWRIKTQTVLEVLVDKRAEQARKHLDLV